MNGQLFWWKQALIAVLVISTLIPHFEKKICLSVSIIFHQIPKRIESLNNISVRKKTIAKQIESLKSLKYKTKGQSQLFNFKFIKA